MRLNNPLNCNSLEVQQRHLGTPMCCSMRSTHDETDDHRKNSPSESQQPHFRVRFFRASCIFFFSQTGQSPPVFCPRKRPAARTSEEHPRDSLTTKSLPCGKSAPSTPYASPRNSFDPFIYTSSPSGDVSLSICSAVVDCLLTPVLIFNV